MRPRLLLVEDDPTTRAFLAAASEALPADVDTADSVASARAHIAQRDYALWLFDANLPDGSGTELLSTLRAQGLQTPAIAHTAAHGRAELDALVASGFTAAVSKPIQSGAWRATLQDILAGHGTGAADVSPDTQADASLPVWDMSAALAAMNGQAAHVDALRALFLAELPPTRATMKQAFANGDTEVLLSTLHKLRASCGFVGAARLDAAARALRADPRSQDAMSAFLAALQDTLSS